GRRRADLLRRRIGGDELREAGLDGVETLAQRVVFGIGDAGRVLLVVALVVALQFERQSFQLHLGLRPGEFRDFGDNGFSGFCCHDGCARPGMTYAVAARSSRSAAALASAVISAPASMRAISSRRRSAASALTRVATRLPLSRASLRSEER